MARTLKHKKGRKRRYQEPKAPFSNYNQIKKQINEYIDFDEKWLDQNRRYKATEEVWKNINRIYRYINAVKETRKKKKDIPDWVNNEQPKKGKEYWKKVSPLFFPIYKDMWDSTLTQKQCIELTEEKDFDYQYNDLPFVFVVPDKKELAKKYGVTEDAIRKIIQRWSFDEDSPLEWMGMTDQKKDGGMDIYAIGYWTDYYDPKTKNREIKRIPFFTKKNSRDFIRKIFFRKS